MSLNKQVHLYSIDTSSFYDEEEMALHRMMLLLYLMRSKTRKEDKKLKRKRKESGEDGCDLEWKVRAINRLLKKLKKRLVSILDGKVGKGLVRALREDAIRDKNVVSIFDSSTTRAIGLKNNTLTEELFIVNVYFFQVFNDITKNGFTYKGEKYVFFCASAGQIRTKKAIFIKEATLKRIEGEITCGLSIEEINSKGGCNRNKYLAYFSLSNSATEVWEDFNIDKAIVVDDFETDVLGEVDFIDDKTYEITRKTMKVPIPHTDGCGIMLNHKTRMIRLPWVKGLMVRFPFDEFIRESCPSGDVEVKDIYGKTYKILEDGIEYILTKSQFKMHSFYSSWDDYKARFKTNKCTANFCNLEKDYIPNAKLNYQFIQSLVDMKDHEIDRTVRHALFDIENIGQDYQTNMRLLGIVEHNDNLSHMQRAVAKYPELMRDQYNREILKDVKRSLIRQAKSGRVRVDGGYRFLSPDLYAFCEWLFLGVRNPKGLLGDGEVYCKRYRDGAELACLRSPHLYREWPVKVNRRSSKLDRWFDSTQCIYTSSHDLISKMLQFDKLSQSNPLGNHGI